MTNARRPLLLALLVALFAATAAFLVFGPLRVMEESAGPLDGLLPPDVDAAARFDPGRLAWSPAAEVLWSHPALLHARTVSGLEEDALEPLRALEERVGRATLGLAPGVGDLLGQEAVLAVRGGDVLLLSRLTRQGKLLESAARLDLDDLRAAGLRVRGDVAVLEREGAPAVLLRRVRDVLVATTSEEMLATATALGEPPEGGVRGVSPYFASLGAGRPPGARVFVWARPRSRAPSASAGDAALGLLAELLSPHAIEELRGVLDLGDGTRVGVELEGTWGPEAPPALALLAESVPGGAGELQSEAERLAVPGEAFAVTGAAVRAADAVRALAEAQPPARRDLVTELLAERGLTVDDVAERLAAYLQDGIAAVVSRLPEADALELDDPRAGGVHPIPATLVAFRLRAGASPAAVIAELADESEALFGAPLLTAPEDAPGGALLHRLEKHRFGGEWELLRPAVAVVDGLLVFSTHEAHLVRALAQRAAGASPSAGDGAEALALRVDVAPLRRHIDDQRWEWADRATRHDWRAEREAIRRELDESGSILQPRDRQVYEDARIEMRLERRNREEFPAAIARFRERWASLGAFAGVRAVADRDPQSFRVAVVIELRAPDGR